MDSPAQKHWRLLKNSFNMFAVKLDALGYRINDFLHLGIHFWSAN